MTAFALLLHLCGLSQREAAVFLDARADTIKSWASGRRSPPEAVLTDLVDLHGKIETAADEALTQLDSLTAAHGAPEEVELGLASDDAEAQSIGWPCVGAHGA